jgi:hypothetical protein
MGKFPNHGYVFAFIFPLFPSSLLTRGTRTVYLQTKTLFKTTENPRFADFRFFMTFLKISKKKFYKNLDFSKKVMKNEKSANLGFSL